MNPTSSDPLADRVAEWAAQITTAHPSPTLCLQGWALRETTKRRGESAQHLSETIDRHLPPLPADQIPDQIERATQNFQQLLANLDNTDDNYDPIRSQARNCFFEILEAFILAEDASGDEETELAKTLFNTIVNDLYVFESMADVAAELKGAELKGDGSHFQTELPDLFCAAVAGLYDGQVRPRPQAEADAEEFVSISEVVRGKSSAKPLTPGTLQNRLARIPFWYVKWVAQRLTLSVVARSADLHVYVWNGEDPASLALSQDLNGWQIRMGEGKDAALATIANATAALKLPKRIDGANFTIQIKDPTAQDWVELFGRVGQMG
jgi:hypothetical protein